MPECSARLDGDVLFSAGQVGHGRGARRHLSWAILTNDSGVAITFRSAQFSDIPALAAVRAAEWETVAYWTRRIGEYLPKDGQQDRMIVIAEDGVSLVGFVAGHLTRRFGCDGELQWINVRRESQGRGIGAMLVREIGSWFVQQGARRICVDVERGNAIARRLYARCGAKPFKPYWLIWEDSRDMVGQRTSQPGM